MADVMLFLFCCLTFLGVVMCIHIFLTCIYVYIYIYYTQLYIHYLDAPTTVKFIMTCSFKSCLCRAIDCCLGMQRRDSAMVGGPCQVSNEKNPGCLGYIGDYTAH